MIYLDNMTGEQTVLIPRTGIQSTGELTLRLRNTVDLKEYDIPVTEREDTDAQLYHLLDIRLPEGMDAGSYEYTLACGGLTVSSGCLGIGDYTHRYGQYDKEQEYRQYDCCE